MYITQKHLSRRTVLRGLGATVALPFLDAMVPAATQLRKTAARRTPRLAAIEMVHGAAGSSVEGLEKHYWSPVKEGRDFDFTLSLSPLEPYRDYLTIISDTDLANAESTSAPEVGGDHNRSSAVFLTASHPKRTEGSDISAGVSMDQIYARKFGQDTALPSIQLCIENVGSISGACGYGYSCVYSTAISWASPTMPFPSERDPRVVFERLFGHGATASERTARRQQNLTILDSIRDRVARIQKDLGSSDRNRLGEYLESVGEIERRLQNVERQNLNGTTRELPDAPVGVPDSFDEHTRSMFDLQVLAFATEVTRVSSFKMGRDVSARVYPESGVTTPFHASSHHGDKSKNIEDFAKLNKYHVGTVAYFLEKLRNTPDGEGNLLDNSVVLYGSPMADGNRHSHKRLPLFLAGHGGGQIKGNLHLKTPLGTPMANALLTVLHRLGVDDVDRIGDSTGDLAI
jgi:Protein of unknown function (DUF1552)